MAGALSAASFVCGSSLNRSVRSTSESQLSALDASSLARVR